MGRIPSYTYHTLVDIRTSYQVKGSQGSCYEVAWPMPTHNHHYDSNFTYLVSTERDKQTNIIIIICESNLEICCDYCKYTLESHTHTHTYIYIFCICYIKKWHVISKENGVNLHRFRNFISPSPLNYFQLTFKAAFKAAAATAADSIPLAPASGMNEICPLKRDHIERKMKFNEPTINFRGIC